MERQFGTLQAFFLSLFSRGFYRDVAQNWSGIGLIYLATLIFFCLIPSATRLYLSLQSLQEQKPSYEGSYLNIAEEVSIIASQLPDLIIHNGEISTDVEQPYAINDDKGETLVLIDTTGKTTTLRDSKASVLVTKDYILMKIDENNIERITVTDILRLFNTDTKTELHINQQNFAPWIAGKAGFIATFFFISSYMFYLFTYLIRSLFFAGFGILFSALMKTELTIKTLIRLAAISATPIIVMESITLLMGQTIFKSPGLVYLALHAGYLFFAIESNRKKIS